MEPCRTTAIAEFDAPRASVTRDVAAYLAVVTQEQTRYVESLASATALLGDHVGELAGVAAQQVRLSQQFVDAQRSLLRMWADTDAKVGRITESATLEAALLGLAVDGLIDVDVAAGVDDAAEHELRRLLDRWWEVARLEGLRAIERAQAATDHWLEVARLASDDEPLSLDEPVPPTPEPEHAEPAAERPVMLPAPVAGALAGASGSSLTVVLDTLLELLRDDEDVLAPVLVMPAADDAAVGASTPAPTDGFDRFWTSAPGRVQPPVARRHLIRDAVVPMIVVAALLVLLLAVIG